ncbi:uncharacterized protein L3040_007094 [Drepanopeziza brunnea f. sp. 'multigermtubi']|uniref:uncharacterized protein n=1 Tax=Drepanopeziza brunnea f. sp. 'multigermtubi' TaxID=698441 RepID=UPI00238EF905|nr:hypothetical protein L3040_007094 [Drepanopeziza brunnea f. sp. 'multigermtubi']
MFKYRAYGWQPFAPPAPQGAEEIDTHAESPFLPLSLPLAAPGLRYQSIQQKIKPNSETRCQSTPVNLGSQSSPAQSGEPIALVASKKATRSNAIKKHVRIAAEHDGEKGGRVRYTLRVEEERDLKHMGISERQMAALMTGPFSNLGRSPISRLCGAAAPTIALRYLATVIFKNIIIFSPYVNCIYRLKTHSALGAEARDKVFADLFGYESTTVQA